MGFIIGFILGAVLCGLYIAAEEKYPFLRKSAGNKANKKAG